MSNVAEETIIATSAENNLAHVFTYNPALQKKLDKLCVERPDEVVMTVECNGSKNYTCPKSWIKVNAPRKKKVSE